MAAVQHEPVAEEVVQFLPAPPPPPPLPPPPPSHPPTPPSPSPPHFPQRITFLWAPHVQEWCFFFFCVCVFFSSSFLPLSNQLTKALPFRRVFFFPLFFFFCSLPPPLARRFSLFTKHTSFFLSTVGFLALFLEPCVPPPPPPASSFLPPLLLLPGQLFSSGSGEERWSRFVSSSPSGQGSRGAHGSPLSLSLPLSLPHPRLSLHRVMREQRCGR